MSEVQKKKLWSLYEGLSIALVTVILVFGGTQIVAYANTDSHGDNCTKAMVMVGGSMKPIGPCQ
jgi:hypothetical protein